MQLKLQQDDLAMQSLPWVSPLALAAGITEPYWALLYSGAQAGYSGRYSYLGYGLAERIEGEDFSVLENALTSHGDCFENAWFGYLGYGLKDELENLTPEKPPSLALPKLLMMRFRNICMFDHERQAMSLWSSEPNPALPTAASKLGYPVRVSRITSNMTKPEYLEKVASIIERIHAGELYQANFTRKFMGKFDSEPDTFTLFTRLCEVSPAPYSVFMRMGDVSILSSSPERFLSIDTQGQVIARPIKGTAARVPNAQQDKASREALAMSTKDRAENLMIVDLMRNDLSRSCVAGSVAVKTLFEVTTHPTIHHMSSTIVGQKKPECSTVDVVKQCFPPGSMTGAPKIKAMNLCAELENQARGIYSGAIGWFGGDGSCDLSVVIRTLIIKDRDFEFQVGGGIVADSIPQQEFTETINKAKGLLLALGLSDNALELL